MNGKECQTGVNTKRTFRFVRHLVSLCHGWLGLERTHGLRIDSEQTRDRPDAHNSVLVSWTPHPPDTVPIYHNLRAHKSNNVANLALISRLLVDSSNSYLDVREPVLGDTRDRIYTDTMEMNNQWMSNESSLAYSHMRRIQLFWFEQVLSLTLLLCTKFRQAMEKRRCHDLLTYFVSVFFC